MVTFLKYAFKEAPLSGMAETNEVSSTSIKYSLLFALWTIACASLLTSYAEARVVPAVNIEMIVNVDCTIRGMRIGVRGFVVTTSKNSRKQTTEFLRENVVVARSIIDIVGTAPVGLFTEVKVGGAFKTFPKEQLIEAKTAIHAALGVTAQELATCVAPHRPSQSTRGSKQT